MADAEIYVDGIAAMRFRNLNSSLEEARAVILEEHPEAAGDRILRTLEVARIDEESSVMSRIETVTPLLHDTQRSCDPFCSEYPGVHCCYKTYHFLRAERVIYNINQITQWAIRTRMSFPASIVLSFNSPIMPSKAAVDGTI